MIKNIFLFCSLFISTNALAEIKLLDMASYDWDLMGDKFEFSADICSCDLSDSGESAVGFKVTIVEPIGSTSSYNEAWKVPALGIRLGNPRLKSGTSRASGNNRRYTRFISFPILSALNIMGDYICFEPFSTMTLLNHSEVNPIALNDFMSSKWQMTRGLHSNLIYLNPIGTLAALLDCVQVTLGNVNDSLKFSAGCSGLLGSGSNFGTFKSNDPVMLHHNLSAMTLDYMHATYMIKKTTNASMEFSPDSKIYNTQCGAKPFGSIIKSQYYLQLISPTVWSGVRLGDFPTKHANFKITPQSGDDIVSIVWITKDMCAGAMKCVSSFGK